MGVQPFRLSTAFHEKIWGTTATAPWFPSDNRKIGEVWFGCEQPLPLLLKFIFTSENLSVQVHPDDDYAAIHHGCAGKTEMWYILRAAPGACLAMGFRECLTPERLRESAVSGEIERLLNWVPVSAGETYFIPAGTVHAIGAGIALFEVQQFSDVTYRLFDYGRPRELHLEHGVAVSKAEPHPGKTYPQVLADGFERLASCRYFCTDRRLIRKPLVLEPHTRGFQVLAFTSGTGRIGDQAYRQGEAWYLPEGCSLPVLPETETELLRVSVPAA